MARYRVGEGGIRVTTRGGAVYSLPPGTVLDELPVRYEGKLIAEQLDEAPAESLLTNPIFRKRLKNYERQVIRPPEDKSL